MVDDAFKNGLALGMVLGQAFMWLMVWWSGRRDR
jgi:hypothetical protein